MIKCFFWNTLYIHNDILESLKPVVHNGTSLMILGDTKCASIPSSEPLISIDRIHKEFEMTMRVYPVCKRMDRMRGKLHNMIAFSGDDGVLPDTLPFPRNLPFLAAIICSRTSLGNASLMMFVYSVWNKR